VEELIKAPVQPVGADFFDRDAEQDRRGRRRTTLRRTMKSATEILFLITARRSCPWSILRCTNSRKTTSPFLARLRRPDRPATHASGWSSWERAALWQTLRSANF